MKRLVPNACQYVRVLIIALFPWHKVISKAIAPLSWLAAQGCFCSNAKLTLSESSETCKSVVCPTVDPATTSTGAETNLNMVIGVTGLSVLTMKS